MGKFDFESSTYISEFDVESLLLDTPLDIEPIEMSNSSDVFVNIESLNNSDNEMLPGLEFETGELTEQNTLFNVSSSFCILNQPELDDAFSFPLHFSDSSNDDPDSSSITEVTPAPGTKTRTPATRTGGLGRTKGGPKGSRKKGRSGAMTKKDKGHLHRRSGKKGGGAKGNLWRGAKGNLWRGGMPPVSPLKGQRSGSSHQSIFLTGLPVNRGKPTGMALGLSESTSRSSREGSSTSSLSGRSRKGTSTVPTRTGRWTPEEHQKFLEGIAKHGRNWEKVSANVLTRTTVQIRSHAQKYFKKLAQKEMSGELPTDFQLFPGRE